MTDLIRYTGSALVGPDADLVPKRLREQATTAVSRQVVRGLAGAASVQADAYEEEARLDAGYRLARAAQRNVVELSLDEAEFAEQAPHAARRLAAIADEYAYLARNSVARVANGW